MSCCRVLKNNTVNVFDAIRFQDIGFLMTMFIFYFMRSITIDIKLGERTVTKIHFSLQRVMDRSCPGSWGGWSSRHRCFHLKAKRRVLKFILLSFYYPISQCVWPAREFILNNLCPIVVGSTRGAGAATVSCVYFVSFRKPETFLGDAERTRQTDVSSSVLLIWVPGSVSPQQDVRFHHSKICESQRTTGTQSLVPLLLVSFHHVHFCLMDTDVFLLFD